MDTLVEVLQYKGKSGQWAWIFHRFSGLLTVVFVVTHVLDSTLITFFPKLYKKTIELFKHPLAGLGEIVLIGAVLYHAVNGLKVAVLDFRPQLWRRQKEANQIVQVVFALLFIPIAVRMLAGTLKHLGGD
ncbi:MAG: succinate dehydrogenase, cytochrome b556 subunit [Anaerolineales bacterium]|nr:succinate dehydrogenase, cytochrome b556 subunit [Anaerolineales bacterium]